MIVRKLASSVPCVLSSLMETLCSCRARADAFAVTSWFWWIELVTDLRSSFELSSPRRRRQRHRAVASGERRPEIQPVRMLCLVLGGHRGVRLLGHTPFAVALERVLDDLLVLLRRGRPFLMRYGHGLTGRHRHGKDQLPLLDADGVHLQAFQMQPADG